MKTLETHSTQETQKAGADLAKSCKPGTILCLTGDLGSGKTTFTQGVLKALGAQKPYVSPTFLIMKEYELSNSEIERIHHIDAYRIGPEDMQLIGWEDLLLDKKNVVIIEWPERIKDIISSDAKWVHFKWKDENTRSITIK